MGRDVAEGAGGAVGDPVRLDALRRLALLDTPPEESFDRYTRLAAALLDAPAALVSLVDDERQFFKSCYGLVGADTSLSGSFCRHVVGGAAPLVIADAREHPLVRDYPSVRGRDVLAYAGIPLVTRGGHVLGSFCVVDSRPRDWSDAQVAVLGDLAAAVMAEIELRAATETAERQAAALRRSQEHLRAAFEHAPIGMALVDLDGRWLQVNAALCELTGYPERDLLATTFQDITHPDDLEADLAQVQRLLAGEIRSYRMEKRYLRADGRMVWALLSVSLVRDDRGAPLHFISQIEDVTGRKRAEAALRASEERFRSLFDQAPAMFVLTRDRDGVPHVSDCNELFLTTLGRARGDVVGRPMRDFYSPASWAALLEEGAYRRVLGGASATAERGLLAGDGRVVESLLRAQPDYGPDGVIVGTVAMYVDISEQKRAEEALRASEQRLRAVVGGAPIVLFTLDRDGVFTMSEGKGLEALGVAPGSSVGRSVGEVYRARPDIVAHVRRALAGEALTETVELAGVAFEVRFAPLHDADGSPAGAIGVATDITDRRRAERTLARAMGDLEERTRALEAKTREQEAFIYSVSHDLRAPLVSLQGLAQFLIEDHAAELPAEACRYLDRIAANAGRMQELIADLLEFSRVGQVEADHGPVDLAAVVRDVVEQLGHTLAVRGATVEVAGGLPTVRADRVRMAQLFANLIANAVAYTPAERVPLVRLAAAERPDQWEISVSDNGVGIPAAWQEKVFRLFQRLPDGKALNPAGSGVGLAIVARIVEAHGGRLWVESSESVGTTFRLTLPKLAPPPITAPPADG